MGTYSNLSALKNIEVFTSFYKKRKIIVAFFVVTVSIVFIALVYCYLITGIISNKIINEYVNCIKDKNYSEAIRYYKDIPYSSGVTNDEVITALKNRYEYISDISILDMKNTDIANIKSAVLKISEGSSFHEDNVSLITEKKSIILHKSDVKIVFPFKLEDIIINGTDGCEVYLDGKYLNQIKNSYLNVKSVICGDHEIESKIRGICSSGKIKFNINEQRQTIFLPSILDKDFKEKINKVIIGFCDGWASYCLNRRPELIKPYLSEKLYDQYTKDNSKFSGSKYTNVKYSVNFLEYKLLDPENIVVAVNENWLLKEVITASNLRFQDNNKKELEQKQDITWNYKLSDEEGIWKIQSVEQVNFKKEVINSH